jgi:hypothetical protein
MIGRVYRWRGELWQVRVRWAGRGPRNVLIENVRTGAWTIRPFRGLRRATVWITPTSGVFHVSKRCAEVRSHSIGWRAADLTEAANPDFYRPCGVCARKPLSPQKAKRRPVAAARAAR